MENITNNDIQSQEFPEQIESSETHQKLAEELTKSDIREPQQYPIQVCEPVLKEGLKTYVIYTIKVENNQENIYRRYSDFFCLRDKLTERWPGIYIPNIPQKKAMGNLDMKIIGSRMKLLNKFCLKLYSFSTIFYSVEMKTFLSNDIQDIQKGLNNLPIQTYENIYLKYKQAFAEYPESYDFESAKTKIYEFHTFLKKALLNLKNFKDVVLNTIAKKQIEINNYLYLLTLFSDYEKNSLMGYSDNDDSKLIFFNACNNDLSLKLLKIKEGMDNPYIPLEEWLQEDEIDIEAMIQAISSLQTLCENKDKLVQNIASLDETLKAIQAGKKTLKTFFSFKSKSDDIIQIESEKFAAEKTYSELEAVIKIAIYNMESQIENFKTEKLTVYYQNLKRFAELEKINSHKIEELWETVTTNKIIKNIN